MTKEEFDLIVKDMHEKGLDDDQIMRILYETFSRGDCDINDYEIMVNWLGYELTDDFYRDHGIKRKATKQKEMENYEK